MSNLLGLHQLYKRVKNSSFASLAVSDEKGKDQQERALLEPQQQTAEKGWGKQKI